MPGGKSWTTRENAEMIAAVIVQVLQSADSVDFENQIYPHLREVEVTRGDYARAATRMKQAGVERDADAIRSHFFQWKVACKKRTGEDVPKKFKGQSRYASEGKKRKRKLIVESDEEGEEDDELNDETVRPKKSSRNKIAQKGKGSLGLNVEKEDDDEDEVKGFNVDGNEAGMLKKREGKDGEEDDSSSHIKGNGCLGKISFVSRGSPLGPLSLR